LLLGQCLAYQLQVSGSVVQLAVSHTPTLKATGVLSWPSGSETITVPGYVATFGQLIVDTAPSIGPLQPLTLPL
jgi:hypothetical protein